jgi:hypothetical protein
MMLFSKKVVLVTLSLGATVMSGRVLAANLNRARTPKTEIKTSNGETPALTLTKETVCDEYKEEDEVSGLCIAYCKAKNCHETESLIIQAVSNSRKTTSVSPIWKIFHVSQLTLLTLTLMQMLRIPMSMVTLYGQNMKAQ